MMDRADYWKLRALSEQRDKELLEGRLALLMKQLDASRTAARLDAVMTKVKVDGGADLTIGNWTPDDAREQFVPTPSQDAPVKPPFRRKPAEAKAPSKLDGR
jgi:hypothetical protein